HGKVSWLGAFQNLVHIICNSPVILSLIGSIGYEATSFDHVISFRHRRQSVLYGKVRNLFSVNYEQRIPSRNERAHARLGRRLKRALKIGVLTLYLQGLKRYLQSTRCSLVLSKTNARVWRVRQQVSNA